MPDQTGYVSLKNGCGTTIKNVSLSLVVDGNATSPLIQYPSLSDRMTTRNTKYCYPGGSSADWRVSFMLNDVETEGSISCLLTSADNNKTLKIALAADSFTISPPVSDSAAGMYSS